MGAPRRPVQWPALKYVWTIPEDAARSTRLITEGAYAVARRFLLLVDAT